MTPSATSTGSPEPRPSTGLEGPGPHEVGARAATADRLHDRYRAYRRRQVRALLSLIPREGIRALHLRSARWGTEAGGGDEADIALLLEQAERVLPLPPFDVWVTDFRRHPDAHLEDEDPGDGVDPAVLEVRSFEAAGTRWYASLVVRPDVDGWRGHVAFHPQGGTRSSATGEIFREDRPASVRNRFREFDEHTLRAFLRSASP